MKYSVIIPIYNSEKTLKRCVDSLINQNYSDCEIILINDGSKDSSDKICREYSEQFSNIRYLYKENGGVSSARNKGLEMAKGKYVLFVDADDYISENYFSVLDSVLSEYDYDYVIFSNSYFDEKTVSDRPLQERKLFSKEEFVPIIAREIINKTVNGPVNKIFKKSIIDKLGLRFSEELSIGEDNIFNLIYLYETENYRVISDVLYHVSLENENSLSRKVRSDLKEQFKRGEEINLEGLQKSSLDEKYKKQYIASFNFLKYADIYSEAKRLRIKKAPLLKRLKAIRKYCEEVNSKKLIIPSDRRSRLLSLPVKLKLILLIDIAGWYLSRQVKI